MADMFTMEKRSSIMSRIRCKGNCSTEQRLIAIMKRFRITGWRRGIKLPGKPDFVFRQARVVVFVDGDFWHGNPRGYRLPKSNVEYWQNKIERDRARQGSYQNAETARLARDQNLESAMGDEEAVAAKISAVTMRYVNAQPANC